MFSQKFKIRFKVFIIIKRQMVESQWSNRLQRFLIRYYQIQWWQKVNLIFYFIIETALSVFLTLLPVKLAFNDVLQQVPYFQNTLDVVALVVFIMHIYLYLNYKVGKLVRNPEIQKKWLLQNKVIKLRWLNLVTIELIYDLICLGIAIYEVIITYRPVVAVLLQLIYLLKIYKIKKFNDRIQSYIIGTGFYLLYNVIYGLFILVILVSYVGCIFYLIDYLYYQNGYSYPQLLWIYQSQSWNRIIDEGFGVQLLYSMYWSLGTASAAAYGNISASAPPDVIYNIICLYFQGFLFGFYLSRIHSLPQSIARKQNQLLELFQKFQQHNQDIKEKGQNISKELYFRILCSLQYQQSRKKSLTYIQSILPQQYIVEIKTHVFKDFLEMNPFSLSQEIQLKRKLSMIILELTTQVGEELYDYNDICFNDLVFIKSGQVDSYLEIDNQKTFLTNSKEGEVIGSFSFLTNLRCKWLKSKMQSYSVLLILNRKELKKLYNTKKMIKLQELFEESLSLNREDLSGNTLHQYSKYITSQESDILFLNAGYSSKYIQKTLQKDAQENMHHRKHFQRKNREKSKKLKQRKPKKISIGVQCDQNNKTSLIEIVLIVQ